MASECRTGEVVSSGARLGRVLLGLAAIATGRPALGRPADAPPPVPPPIRSPITETVSSELVLIETYVTDGLGHPVRDLTRDDFILEVGGLRRPIASVEFHSAGAPGEATAGDAIRAAGSPPPAAAGPEWPRRFVIFFDDNTSGAAGLAEARHAAERFLATGLEPTDQVAIAACEPPLRLVHDFTTDREALRQSLRRDLNAARRGTSFFTEMREGLETISFASPKTVQSYCELLEARWAGTLSAVQAVATALSGWRGHKEIIFMGDGVPEYPMDEIYRLMELLALRLKGDPPMFQLTCTLGDELKDLSRTASAAGVTLNTIETRGLSAGPQGGGKWSFLSVNSLRMLADTTGGQSSTSNDFVAAFRAIDRASREYYVLGYVPEEPADGRFRHVIVRCRRKGVSLRFRRGFTRLPPGEARIKAIENAHLFPEMHGEADLTLDAVDGPADPGGRTVDLVLHLPAARLLFQPGPEGASARMTVGFVAIDAARRETLRVARHASILSDQERSPTVAGVNVLYRARLPLAAQSVTAVVQDEASGWVGAARYDLDADPAPRRPLLGLSLYATDEAALWLEVPHDAKDGVDTIAASAHARGPASRTTFYPGESIVAAFRLAPGPGLPEPLRLDIMRDGAVVRSTPVGSDAASAARSVKVVLSAAGLAAGDYRLAVRTFIDGAPVERGTKPFRIVDRDPIAAAP